MSAPREQEPPPPPDGEEEVCGETYDHPWQPGDVECRRCGADLSHWNDDIDEGGTG